MHLLVDSTRLKLFGAGEWLVEKHGTRMRRSWRKLHIGLDAETGQVIAASLTPNEIDDGAEVGALLDQVDAASFPADGGYDQDGCPPRGLLADSLAACGADSGQRRLEIPGEPSAAAEPSESAFDHPASRQHLEPLGRV